VDGPPAGGDGQDGAGRRRQRTPNQVNGSAHLNEVERELI